MQAAKQRRHDAGKAVTARDPFQQAVLDPDHLDDPGQPGKPARQRQRKRLVEGDVDACMTRCFTIQADRPDAVADRRAPEEDVDDDRQDHRDDRAGVQQSLRDETGEPHLFGKAFGLGQVRARLDAGRIDHRALQQEVHQLNPDGVHHHGGQDFVDVQAGLEDAGNEAPHGPANKAHHHRCGEQQPAGPGAKGQREPRCQQRAGDDLPFAADVDDAGAKGDTDAEPHQEQGGGLDEGLRKAVHAAKHPGDQGSVGFGWGWPSSSSSITAPISSAISIASTGSATRKPASFQSNVSLRRGCEVPPDL